MVIFFHAEPWQILVMTSISSVGVGVAFATLPTLIAKQAPIERAGSATGVYQIGRNIGGILSTAAFTAILGALTLSGGKVPTIHAYQIVWAICGTCLLFAAIPLVVLRKTRQAGSL